MSTRTRNTPGAFGRVANNTQALRRWAQEHRRERVAFIKRRKNRPTQSDLDVVESFNKNNGEAAFEQLTDASMSDHENVKFECKAEIVPVP